MRGRLFWTVALLALAVVGCGRGPAPAEPTESLTPTVVGFVQTATSWPVEFQVEGGGSFEPPRGARVDRLKNWPDGVHEPDALREGEFALGGERADGSWWYALASGRGDPHPACVLIFGGSFDRGDAVQLSSGVMLPRAPGFTVRDPQPGPSDWFPGHAADAICVDAQGRAVYFQPFHPA